MIILIRNQLGALLRFIGHRVRALPDEAEKQAAARQARERGMDRVPDGNVNGVTWQRRPFIPSQGQSFGARAPRWKLRTACDVSAASFCAAAAFG